MGVKKTRAVPRRTEKFSDDRSRAPDEGFQELTWSHFDSLSRGLATGIAAYAPDVVIGVVKGGLFVGSAVAGLLGCPFLPVRLESRTRDTGSSFADPRADRRSEVRSEVRSEDVRGKRVLVVDDVMQSGKTLRRAVDAARSAGAFEVRSATLVVRKKGAKERGADRPDWYALETDDLVVFPWDYELRGSGQGESDPGTFGA